MNEIQESIASGIGGRDGLEMGEEFLRRDFESREGEEGFAQVLERRAEVVGDLVVDEQKTVVDAAAGPYGDGRVLRVVFLHVEPELRGAFARVDGRGDAIAPCAEHGQDRLVDVVVDEHQGPPCALDELHRSGVGVADLPIEEHALHRRQRGLEDDADLLVVPGDFGLQAVQTVVDRIAAQEIVFQNRGGPECPGVI